MKIVLMVGLGGFLGSISRYLVSGWVQSAIRNSVFPFGTLVVNVVGCLIIGFLGGLFENRQLFDPGLRAFLFIGLLGGFTTFSAFSYETTAMIRDNAIAQAALNIGLQIALGLGAAWGGYKLAQLL